MPWFPRHSWAPLQLVKAGSCQACWPDRAGKALVWREDTESSWPTLPAKQSPSIKPNKADSSDQPSKIPSGSASGFILPASNEGPGVKPLESNRTSSSVVSRPCLLNATAYLYLHCSLTQAFPPGPSCNGVDEAALAGRVVMEWEEAAARCCELKATAQIFLRLWDSPTDAAEPVSSLLCRCFEVPAAWISLQFLLLFFFFPHFQRPFFIHCL